MDQRVSAAIRAWDWETSLEICEGLPLLDRLRSVRRNRLDGWDVLMIQHHLGTFLPLVSALIDDGMSVEHSWHVDIPYSTNAVVSSRLRGRWAEPIRLPPLFTDPLLDYSEAQLLRVSTTVTDIARNARPRPLLVIDDGAYFSRSLLALERTGLLHRSDFNRIALVEQTTRGHRFLAAHGQDLLLRHGIAAVSIARSMTKKEVEAPCIGASVAAAIARKVRPPHKVAVLGYGVMGRVTAAEIKERFPEARLFIVEKRRDALRRAQDESRGRWTALDAIEAESEYDLVVGCTGATAFTVENRHLVCDGANLVSGSSAAIEFDRSGFVDLADYYPDDEVEIVDRIATRKAGIHADVRFRLEGSRHVTFINAGFPVNFDGRVESLPVNMIQATRSLMYAAVGQVISTPRPGLAMLDRGTDDWMMTNALDLL